MKLADVLLKIDRIGSTVPLQRVTPAEVMFLVADHHANAGGDPIVKLVEVEEGTDEKHIEALQQQLESLDKQRDELDLLEITPEIHQRRLKTIEAQIKTKQDGLDFYRRRVALRTIRPADERVRLASKYGARRIKAFFPGNIPNLPETFEEARRQGVGADTLSERLLTVGDLPNQQ